MEHRESHPILVIRAAGHTCALALADVVEVMRPLPAKSVAGAPAAVLGLSIIRGQPVPVIDLGSLLGSPSASPFMRFVTIRLGERRAALGVDAVLGIRELGPEVLADLPPLLREAQGELVEGIGTLDSELLLVLRAARLAPDEIWTELSGQET